MVRNQLPALISHTVLVHAGSYNDFIKKLVAQYPDQKIVFVKRVAIHYYILQIEDNSAAGIKKQELYDLPLMALREEFSSYIFFKNTKSYNNVLKRMCNAGENKNAAYVLLQHMMTPFEKSLLIELKDAKSLCVEEMNEKKEAQSTTYYGETLKSMEVLNKLFSLEKVLVDDEEKEFALEAKNLTWVVGIH